VVEGVGDHACEYMTGGVVVILGPSGRNLAAGMSGGWLYLYDPEVTVHDHLSAGVYEIDLLEAEDDERLQALLVRFREETGSTKAQRILENWRHERMNFVRIETSEYQANSRRGEGWVRSPDFWSTPARARVSTGARSSARLARGLRAPERRGDLPLRGHGAWTAGFPSACRAAPSATSYRPSTTPPTGYQWHQPPNSSSDTNNFPEFTGRLCPAPCESACVLGHQQRSRDDRALEYEVAEHAFAAGFAVSRERPRTRVDDGWRWWARVPQVWPPRPNYAASGTP
jgi:hypothetical protein